MTREESLAFLEKTRKHFEDMTQEEFATQFDAIFAPPPADAEALVDFIGTLAGSVPFEKQFPTWAHHARALLTRPRAVEPECAGPSTPDNRKPAPADAEALREALDSANSQIVVEQGMKEALREALQEIAGLDDDNPLAMAQDIANAAPLARPRAGDGECKHAFATDGINPTTCVKCGYQPSASNPAPAPGAEELAREKHSIAFIDATPDSGYIERILSAYLDDTYYSDNTAGMPISNPVVILVNENREKRNVLLREAIARLRAWAGRQG